MAKRTNDVPAYYVFEDRGKWTRTSAQLTKELNNHVFRRIDFDTCGHSFYPQWTAPLDPDEERTAWMVDSQGFQVARTGFIITEHNRTHRFCKPRGGGECIVQVIRKVVFDQKTKLWILKPLENEAQGASTDNH